MHAQGLDTVTDWVPQKAILRSIQEGSMSENSAKGKVGILVSVFQSQRF